MNDGIETIARYWDGQAQGFDSDHDEEDLGIWRRELARLTGLQKGERLLDVGVGTGFLALMAAELGFDATGVDVSRDMMAIGEEKAHRLGVSVKFVFGEGEHLPFEDDYFGAVVNCRVVWTLLNPHAAFTEWRRVLRPGGRLVSFIRKFAPDFMTEEIYSDDFDARLPLKRAKDEDYIKFMTEAGFSAARIEPLPEAASRSSMPGWIAIVGDK